MKRIVATLAALVFATALQADNQTVETWQVKWGAQQCTLVMTFDALKLQGPVRVVQPCGKELRKVKSFVYTDDRRSDMILFPRRGAQGAMVGSFTKSGKSTMKGLIGDGIEATMYLSSRSSVTVNLGGNTGGSGSCVKYANGGCASQADLGNPSIRFGQTANMRALGQLTIYPFSGGKGFAKDEKVSTGQCRQIKKCETAFGTDEDWCEVVLSDGFFTGWVKRKDDNFVYLRSGC